MASLLGLFFSAYSTYDYTEHLDRQLHGTHCSFLPGLVDASAGANACTAAMYSPYSAVFRTTFWGGIPISLFALGSYLFFLSFSVYVWIAGAGASRRTLQAFGATAILPVGVSVVMFFVSILRLGGICKLCAGLYVASVMLAAAGFLAFQRSQAPRQSASDTVPNAVYHADSRPTDAFLAAAARLSPPRPGHIIVIPIFLMLLGMFTLVPAAVYAASLPSYTSYLRSCGKLIEKNETHHALVKIATKSPKQPALLVVDPLCPTCKAFHERLVDEGIFENLDVEVAIFPLDNECNWMLDRAMHPGACVVAKAFLCGEKSGKSRNVLEWSYDHQDELLDLAKGGKELLRAKVRNAFPELDRCIDEKDTQKRLEHVLHYAIANKLPVSTPQFFMGETKVCDEDTDLGLRYTLGQIAPGALP